MNNVICKVSDFGMSKLVPGEKLYYTVDSTKSNPIPVRVCFFFIKFIFISIHFLYISY